MPSSWGNPWIQLGLDPGRFPIPSPGDIPNPGLKPRSPTLQILYHLSHQGNPRMLEWVAYPFSRDITVILSNLPASKLILHLKFTWSLVRGQAKIECPSKAYYKVHFVLISLHPKRQCGVIKHWFELKKNIFFMWTIFKSLYWICHSIVSVSCFGFWSPGIWDLSSPTSDLSCTPCIGR